MEEKTNATSTLQPSSTGFTACAYVQRRPPSRHGHGCIDHGRIGPQPPLLQLGQHRGSEEPRKNLTFHGEVLAVQLVITLGVLGIEVKVPVIKPVDLLEQKDVTVLKSFGVILKFNCELVVQVGNVEKRLSLSTFVRYSVLLEAPKCILLTS